MQRPIQGMTGNDQHILRLLYESGLALRVGDIQFNLDHCYDVQIPESTLYRRLSTMDYAGLLDLITDNPSRYEISDLGKKYADGEISNEQAAEIETKYQEYEY